MCEKESERPSFQKSDFFHGKGSDVSVSAGMNTGGNVSKPGVKSHT